MDLQWRRAESADISDVELVTTKGVTLRAWFMRPPNTNGNMVILLHGVSDNRLGMYGYGRWLNQNHYAVLLPDARGHGLSGGLATYGLLESDDIHRWVSWLEETQHPSCVYGLGESMGAAQLLQALPKEPRFCAVVAESPFATFREVAYARFGREFHTGPWLGSSFFRPTVEVGLLYVRLRYWIRYGKIFPSRSCCRHENSSATNPRNQRSQHSGLPLRGNPTKESLRCGALESSRCNPHWCAPGRTRRVRAQSAWMVCSPRIVERT